MSNITIEQMDRLPVYRKCSNCNGHGYFEITDEHYSTGDPFTWPTSCYLCAGSCIEHTGRYVYYSQQGYVVEEEGGG